MLAIFRSLVVRAGMLAVVLLCLAPAAARAGTYEVWTCAGPDGEPAPADGWLAEGGAVLEPGQRLRSGGGLYAGLNGAFDHPNRRPTWHFKAPANTKIRATGSGARRTSTRTAAYETPIYTMTGKLNLYDGAYVVEQCPAPGCRGRGLGYHAARPPANLVADPTSPTCATCCSTRHCGGGAPADRVPSGRDRRDPDTSSFRMYRAAFVLQDDSDPVFTSPPAGR